MVVGIEGTIPNTATTTPPNPIPQTPGLRVNPGQDRRAGGRRSSDKDAQGKSEFKAALDAVTAEKFAAEVALNARRALREAAAAKALRGEKRPTRQPVELGAEESEKLYQATQPVVAGPLNIPSSPEFFSAASRYAERFFSVRGPQAKPGESLELSA
jgi:hypothetical protein